MPKSEHPIIQALRLFAKLWVIVTAVIGSLLVIGIALIVLAIHQGPNSSNSGLPAQKVISEDGADRIAILNFDGEIVESATSNGVVGNPNVISAEKVTRLLDQVAKDKQIKAVVIRLNTPGGSVVASDEIYEKIKALRSVKPVVISMSDVAASGGYYISAAANSIVANPATITGSIGVISHFPKLSGLYDKLGVEMRTIKSGQFKDIGSESRDFTPEEQTIFQNMINEAYDQFVHAVSDGRKMDEAKVRQLADGRIYTGKQAQENGLVDELGNEDVAINKAKDLAHLTHASLVEFSDQGFFESLFQSKLNSFSLGTLADTVLPTRSFGVYYLLEP